MPPPIASDLDLLADFDAIDAELQPRVSTESMAHLIGAKTAKSQDPERENLRRAFAAAEAQALPDGWSWSKERTHLLGPVVHGLQERLTPEQFDERQRFQAGQRENQLEAAQRLNEHMGPVLGSLASGAASSLDATRRLIGVDTPDGSAAVDRLNDASTTLDPSLMGDVTRGVGGLVADLPLMLTGAPLAKGAVNAIKIARMRAALSEFVGSTAARKIASAAPVAAAVQPLAVREGVNADGGIDNKLSAWLVETAIPAAFGRTGVERAIVGGGPAAAGGLRAAAIQLLKDAGVEAGEEAATEGTHALHEYATGADPQALQLTSLIRRMTVAGAVGAGAGGAFNLPGAIEQARAPSVEQAQAQALSRADLERVLATLPDSPPNQRIGNPRDGLRDPAMQSADQRSAVLASASIPTPPSAAGLDPEVDDAPLPEADPLLEMTPTEVGRFARADSSAPTTVGMDEAPTGPVEPVADPDLIPVSDASDFDRFLDERGVTPAQHAAASAQTADLAPFVPGDDKAVVVGPSKIAGQGIVAQAQMDPGAGVVAMTAEGKRTPVGRYVNHSAKPNAKAVLTPRGLELVPTRAIAPGEELTISYRQARGPAIELGKRITADPVRVEQNPPTPAKKASAPPAPSVPEPSPVDQHAALSAGLARWQDLEAQARGEGTAGANRADNATKSAKSAQGRINALEARMTPAELAQVRPRAAPESATSSAQDSRTAPKAPPTPIAAPPEIASRQIDGERPPRPSAAPPAQIRQPAPASISDPAVELERARAEVARLEAAAAKPLATNTELPKQEAEPAKSEAEPAKPLESPDGSPSVVGPQDTPLAAS